MKKLISAIQIFAKKHPIISAIVLFGIIGMLFPQINRINSAEKAKIVAANSVSETLEFTDLNDVKFVDNRIRFLEDKLKNNFWVEFRPATKRGGKGPVSINFDLTKYEKFMQDEGFKKTPNGSLREYTQIKNDFITTLSENGRYLSEEGYVDNWNITITKNINGIKFQKSKTFKCLTPK